MDISQLTAILSLVMLIGATSFGYATLQTNRLRDQVAFLEARVNHLEQLNADKDQQIRLLLENINETSRSQHVMAERRGLRE